MAAHAVQALDPALGIVLQIGDVIYSHTDLGDEPGHPVSLVCPCSSALAPMKPCPKGEYVALFLRTILDHFGGAVILDL